jgi:hypothetical protein
MATGSYNGQTTNKTGTFSVVSDGFIQGMLRNDPVSRYNLAQGILGPNEAFPMFGGVAITEAIPGGSSQWPNGNNDSLGSVITRATSAANISGFVVFDQSFAAPITPYSNVPLIGSGQSVNYIRNGDSQQIAVAIDPTFAASLIGGATSQNVTWDFNAQRIAPYVASGGTISITSITPTFVPAANGVPAYWNMVVVTAANTTGVPTGVGDVVNISGCTNTNAVYVNQNQVVTSYTNTTNWSFKIQNTSSTLFTSGTGLTGTLLLNYSGGALACKILRIDAGNSKNVIYNAQNNTANWQNGLACALIQI